MTLGAESPARADGVQIKGVSVESRVYAAGWLRPACMTVLSAILVVGATACPRLATAQGGMPPMSGMPTDSGASPDRNMTDMMGVPLPFGIMTAPAGTWMAAYQYMFDKLDGMLDGTTRVSETAVLKEFDTTPTNMTMRMHMGMVMYAPTDRLTLMAMLPYMAMSMGELHRDGTRSTERSNGIGDLELRGLYSLYSTRDRGHRVLANFGVGLPTGSVNQRDAEGVRTEYPMQTGTGTLSVLPGLVYLGQALPVSWGGDVSSTVRLGRNQHGYRFGNRYEPRIWIARKLTGFVSMSATASGELWENVHGSDSLLDPTDEPTKDPRRQGGKRVNALLGITFHPATGLLAGQQFLVEGALPMIQSLDGPQLRRSYMLHAAVQWQF